MAVLALAACAPDVHIHIYDDDGDDTDAMFDTDAGFGEGSAAATTSASANASANTSNASASASDSDPTSDDTSASDSDPTDPSDDTNASDSDPSEGGSTGASVDMYPQPSNGTCPDGFGYNLTGEFEFCGPECGDGESCPDPVTGNAQSRCLFNPDSSMSECMSDMCEDSEETCFAGSCMLDATHCVVLCSMADAECPDGMECSASLCRFPV